MQDKIEELTGKVAEYFDDSNDKSEDVKIQNNLLMINNEEGQINMMNSADLGVRRPVTTNASERQIGGLPHHETNRMVMNSAIASETNFFNYQNSQDMNQRMDGLYQPRKGLDTKSQTYVPKFSLD